MGRFLAVKDVRLSYENFVAEAVADEFVWIEPARLASIGECGFLFRRNSIVVFADCLSAEYFLAMMREIVGHCEALTDSTVAANGISTVEVLSRNAVHADVTPLPSDEIGIFPAVSEYCSDAFESVLLVGGDSVFRSRARDWVAMGGKLSFWPPGDTAWAEPKFDPRLRALILGGGIDTVVIGKPSDIVTLELKVGSLVDLKGACDFLVADSTSGESLAEKGILSRLLRS